MDFAELPRALEVLLAEDGALAKVRAEVVDEYASFYVVYRSRLSVNAKRTHQLRG